MLSPFSLGPLFTLEWLTTSRRKQMFLGRSLFVLILFIGLCWVWITKVPYGGFTISKAATVGEYFFYALVGIELAMVLMVAPAATAGSICVDKASGSLLHVLTTDLTNREIVLGKLVAKLLPVIGLIFCSLPVLFGAVLLGGIPPDAVTGAFVVILGVGILSSALALALSAWSRKTYEVLLVTYLFWTLLILIPYLLGWLSRYTKGFLVPVWLEDLDPFRLAFLPYTRPGVDHLVHQFTGFGIYLAIAGSLVVATIVTIRRVAISYSGDSGIKTGRRWRPRLPFWLGPRLDPNPVLWREWHRQRPGGWARAVWFVYAAILTVCTGVVIFDYSGGSLQMSPWVNALGVSIGMLLLSVGPATALQEERVRGSLDMILTTPLRSSSILWGKWWGTYRRAIWLAVLPGLLAFSLAARQDHWGTATVLVFATLSYGAAVTSWGLLVATWIPRTGRALAICIGVYVIVTVGSLMIVLLTGQRGEGTMTLSPFYGPGALTALMTHGGGRRDDVVGWCVFWSLCYYAAAIGLFVVNVAIFDRCVGRAEGGRMKTDPRAYARGPDGS